MFGIFNINKPPHLTSRDVVNRVCRAAGTRNVGHAGTLDPMATGVLIVCVGPATRLVSFVQQLHKSYLADFQLGVESTTEDSFGQVSEVENAPGLDQSQIRDVLPEFVGQIQQVPPAFSALKVEGKRAYKLARSGAKVKLNARQVTIHELELIDFQYPECKLRIECGSGTYIRSLGRDIARRLGTGAIMTKLVRTAVGGFSIDDSVPLVEIEREPQRHLLSPLVGVQDLPQCVIDAEKIKLIANGCFLKQVYVAQRTPITENTNTVVATDSAGRLIAVFERFDQENFKPKINFAHIWRDAN